MGKLVEMRIGSSESRRWEAIDGRERLIAVVDVVDIGSLKITVESSETKLGPRGCVETEKSNKRKGERAKGKERKRINRQISRGRGSGHFPTDEKVGQKSKVKIRM